MSDTPRTDAIVAKAAGRGNYAFRVDALTLARKLERELNEARAEMRRYLPVLERLESSPLTWEMATKGTGIATLNGYRKAAGLDNKREDQT